MLCPLPPLRCTGVAIAATGLAALAARPLVGQLDATTTADQAVVQVCVIALLGCLAWGWATTCAVVIDVWRGSHEVGRRLLVCPRAVRRFVLAACGAAVVGALAAPAHASDGSLAGLPMPERAVGPAHGRPQPAPLPVRPIPGNVLVRPGDSLWLITARQLPPGSSAATITSGWHRLYRLNRAVIGPDPDLIHPGQLLRQPSK